MRRTRSRFPVTVLPAVLVLLFSVLFFVNGMQSWFGDRMLNLSYFLSHVTRPYFRNGTVELT